MRGECPKRLSPSPHCYHFPDEANGGLNYYVGPRVRKCCFCGASERDEHGPYYPGGTMPTWPTFPIQPNMWTPVTTPQPQSPTITYGGQHGPNTAGGVHYNAPLASPENGWPVPVAASTSGKWESSPYYSGPGGVTYPK